MEMQGAVRHHLALFQRMLALPTLKSCCLHLQVQVLPAWHNRNLSHTFPVLFIPPVNTESIPKGTFPGALFQSECLQTDVASLYGTLWDDSPPRRCCNPLSCEWRHPFASFSLERGDASLVASRRQDIRDRRPLKDAFVKDHCAAMRSSLCFETTVIVFPSLHAIFLYLPAFPRGIRQSGCVLPFHGHSVCRGCVHIYHTYLPLLAYTEIPYRQQSVEHGGTGESGLGELERKEFTLPTEQSVLREWFQLSSIANRTLIQAATSLWKLIFRS